MTTRNVQTQAESLADTFAGRWNALKGRLREQWSEITDDELDRLTSMRDQLIGLLQEKYGYTRREASRMLDDFLNEYSAQIQQVQEKASETGRKLARRPAWLVGIGALLSIGLVLVYLFGRGNKRFR